MHSRPCTFQHLYRFGNEAEGGKTGCETSLEGVRISHLDFPSDLLICAKMLELMVHALGTLSMKFESLGLKVSCIKNKMHKFVALVDENVDLPTPVSVHGEDVCVDTLVSFGNAIGRKERSFHKSIDAGE